MTEIWPASGRRTPSTHSIVVVLPAPFGPINSGRRHSQAAPGHAATPQTILGAHVLAKLTITALTMALLVLAGKRYYPVHADFPAFGFTIALLISTWSILSIGFLIASIVPTARFAQPIGAAILYPMIGLCGLFVPVQAMPPAVQVVARALPLTYAVSLLEGIRKGEGLVDTHGRRRGAGGRLCDLYGAFSEGVPLGIARAPGSNSPDTAFEEVRPDYRESASGRPTSA